MTGADGAEWPVELSGVTETVVTTLGPNDRWNAAALGVFAGEPATARTWGKTRTRRNFHRQGKGYVQFVDDPVVFTEAALTISEHDEPVLKASCAWCQVTVEQVDSGTEGGTDWEQWELTPLATTIDRKQVPTIDRGFAAVVEATVLASRLDLEVYDETTLRDRLAYCASVVERAGGPREREALELIRTHTPW